MISQSEVPRHIGSFEAVGARDHWAAERVEGHPLFVPSLDRAVRVIRDAVRDSPRHT
jgi:hypothetical protein